jgi:hypothetical protein
MATPFSVTADKSEDKKSRILDFKPFDRNNQLFLISYQDKTDK